MDDTTQFIQTVYTTTQNMTALMQSLLKSNDADRKMLEDFLADVTRLTGEMEKQSYVRSRRRRFRWSVAIAVVALGLLAIFWSSTIGTSFAKTLLETVAAALITFGLVEVALNDIVEIPTKTVIKQDRIVSELKSGIEKIAKILNDSLDKTAQGQRDVANLIETMKEATSGWSV